jgi:hypothetical protein
VSRLPDLALGHALALDCQGGGKFTGVIRDVTRQASRAGFPGEIYYFGLKMLPSVAWNASFTCVTPFSLATSITLS